MKIQIQQGEMKMNETETTYILSNGAEINKEECHEGWRIESEFYLKGYEEGEYEI